MLSVYLNPMKTPPALLRTVALLAVLTPAALLASGIRTGFKDPDAIARGNAFVATADNPSAIYYNPAGLTQLDGPSLTAGAYDVELQSDYTSGGGATTDMKRDFIALPEFYYAYAPHGSNFAFGLGSFVPFGLKTDWAPTSGFGTVATNNKETDYAIAGVVAWKISPELSIGGGPVFHRIDATLSRDIPPGSGGGTFTFDGSNNALSFNAGVRWQPSAEHAFGLTYRGNYASNLNGTSNFSFGVPTPATGNYAATGNFTFPEVIIGGYSYRPSPDWNFEADVEWMNWDRVNTITVQNPTAVFSPAEPLVLNWNSSFFYDFGVTRQFANGMHVSVGYTYAQNSTPNSSFNPAVPDANRNLFGVGVGGRVGQYDLQATVQYGIAETRTVTGDVVNPTADGTYAGRTYAFALSLSRRF